MRITRQALKPHGEVENPLFDIENDPNLEEASASNRMVEISIVLIVLVVVAIGAFTAWRVMSKNKKNKQIQNDY